MIDRTHSPEQVEGVKQASKVLFGNRTRLQVAAAVSGRAPGAFFHAHELATALGLSDKEVGNDLLRFAEAGILKKNPRAARNQAIYYSRTASVYWDLAQQLLDELLSSPSEHRARTVRTGRDT